MHLEINDKGVIFVENARIHGLTTKGGLLIDVGEGGGFRIDVDPESLVRLRHLIDQHFRQDCSSRSGLEGQS